MMESIPFIFLNQQFPILSETWNWIIGINLSILDSAIVHSLGVKNLESETRGREKALKVSVFQASK